MKKLKKTSDEEPLGKFHADMAVKMIGRCIFRFVQIKTLAAFGAQEVQN